MTALLFRGLALAAPVVGRWPAPFYAAAPLVAFFVWRLKRDLRLRMLKTNAIVCADRARARTTARAALANVVRYYVDLCTIAHRNMASFEREHIAIVGGEHLTALGSGQPVIVLSAHLGSPELAVQAILGRGHPFVALVEPVRPRAYADLLEKLRRGAGGVYVEAGPPGLRACFEALRQGGIVALVADRDIQGHGACATFFGRHIRLPDGAFELAGRTNAILLPVLSYRVRHDQLTLTVEEPFTVADDNRQEAADEAVKRWAAILERHIGRDPGQWTVTEDYFKAHACG